ncbi:MarR family transcriptional regulator [Corynebacterium felinum]|uniref:DNA-binding protein n=1 Tax=Corynebacterium felinum TaxID=131318 RepID=A0ABU2BAQ2_9CORY|nr:MULTISPECIES: MarR family transcriptional regulator [Corynebacterium]MDF5820030.1 MarR family transcriptional regulator [Corynebacterium felinum]MDO4760413.1 MarR family transcriptional regulator [Corynebacterium sp.]MDR7355690.1 hypothetical protein [Corynebacterium felinum]WJY95040.1 hypothetical protein CFELI_07125 [Corynebacterium felinum]
MFAIHARYRGRERRRAELVRNSAQALSTLPGVGEFSVLGVEDIAATIDTPSATCDTTMALLSHGDWAVAIGVAPTDEQALNLARTTLGAHARAGQVKVGIRRQKEAAQDVAGAFLMLAHILAKRTPEGREATSLMRSGYNQNEAAAELEISKQAMSQRLQAAGWQAELAGWRLAVRLLEQADAKTK